MEVRYDVYFEDEDENEDDFDAPMRKIELIFSHITEEEKEILEKYNFKYKYTEDNKIKLKEENAIYYTVEIDEENSTVTEILKNLEKSLTYFINF